MSKITFYGHSCFCIETGRDSILVDPWLTGNPEVGRIPEGLEPTLILVSHNHGDHAGDAVALATRYRAPIVATPALSRHYSAEGAEGIGVHIGGKLTFEWGSVKCVQAIHDSPLAIGESWRVDLGAPCGFILNIGGVTIYHAGDTCLMTDMKLFAPVDVALLPIDGRMTMEPADGVRAATFLEAGLVIPMHWREQDPHAFVSSLENEGIDGRVMSFGESLTL